MTEIPKSPSDATMDMATDGSSLVAVDHDGGRPPDIIPQGKVAQTASSTMDLINKSKDAEDGDGLARSTGKFSEHRAVSILEQDQEMNFREGVQNGNTHGFRMKTAKENLKTGLAIRKPSFTKTISRPVLTEWVDNVNAQLDTIFLQKELEPGETSKVIVSNSGSLEVIQEECRHQCTGGLATDPVVFTDDSNVPMVQ
ncbi:hypothetical protein V6N12_042382 [Hibiscus sabdariffa]|uniref:Uncharacterized protein n=1 Tax=Hibiscus sabdariffa TaxID=183260 RepID=A0ABR2EEL8_9ROSI